MTALTRAERVQRAYAAAMVKARLLRRCPHGRFARQPCLPCTDHAAAIVRDAADRYGVTIPVPPLV